MTDHPNAEILAAWLDGKLSQHERGRIDEHISRCEDCHVVVREAAMALGEHEASGSTPGRLAPRIVRQALPLAAVIVIGLGGRAVWQSRAEPYAAAVAPLVEAVGERRFIEPRLTGGFAYGPRVGPKRSSGGVAATEEWALYAAAGRAREVALQHATPARRRAWAAAALLVGDAELAVSRLTSLAADAPRDARVLADLAAAHLVRASQADRSDDYPRALEAASQAVELDPRLPEALFNRALAAEAVGLRAEAIQAWQAYLVVDSPSGWAEAARERLTSVERAHSDAPLAIDDLLAGVRAQDAAIVNRALTRSTTAAREAFLTRWLLPAALASDARERARLLSEARFLADRLASASGDPFAQQSLAVVPERVSPVASTAGGYRSFQQAQAEYARGDWKAAQQHFDDAANGLRSVDSPLALYADLHLALVRVRTAAGSPQEPWIERTLARAQAAGFRHLQGRCAWVLGAAASKGGRPDRAAAYYTQAREAFRTIRDEEARAFVEAQLSGALEQLGDLSQSWRLRIEAVRGLDLVLEPRYRQAILYGAAVWALDGRLPRTALAFERATLVQAQSDGLAYEIAESRILAARILFGMGHRASARQELEQARPWLAQVRDPLLSARMQAEEDEVVALTALSADEALVALDRARRAFAARDDRARQAGTDLERGVWLRRAQRYGEAETALLQGMSLYASVALPERWQTSRQARASQLYEELLGLRLARGDASGATLAAAEAARHRFYAAGSPSPDMDQLFHRVQARLGPSGAVVVYAFEGARLHAWVITEAGLEQRALVVTPAEVERAVDDLESCLEQAGATPCEGASTAALHAALLAPLDPWLRDKDRLVVVPHRALARVPWSFLRDGSTGTRVVDRAAVIVAPSLSVLDRTGQHPNAEAPLARALFVAGAGAPEHGLPDLPGARAEARRLAESTGSDFLLAGGLSEEEILERVQGRTLVHFSGHALVNESYPAYSALVFGRDPNGKAVRVFAHRWADAGRSAPTVILAACRGASSRSRGDEGVVHLARAFLVGGASQVVAHLWKLDDGAAGKVLTRFYAGLADGLDVPDALRRAQRETFATGDATEVAAAAGFEVWGGRP